MTIVTNKNPFHCPKMPLSRMENMKHGMIGASRKPAIILDRDFRFGMERTS
jgi:hypothetical protein